MKGHRRSEGRMKESGRVEELRDEERMCVQQCPADGRCRSSGQGWRKQDDVRRKQENVQDTEELFPPRCARRPYSLQHYLCPCVIPCAYQCVCVSSVSGSGSHGTARQFTPEINTAQLPWQPPVTLTTSRHGTYLCLRQISVIMLTQTKAAHFSFVPTLKHTCKGH